MLISPNGLKKKPWKSFWNSLLELQMKQNLTIVLLDDKEHLVHVYWGKPKGKFQEVRRCQRERRAEKLGEKTKAYSHRNQHTETAVKWEENKASNSLTISRFSMSPLMKVIPENQGTNPDRDLS